MAVEPLTLKSGIAAPRSPVNNCGLTANGTPADITPSPSGKTAAALNLVDDGVIAWDDPDIVTVLSGALNTVCHSKIDSKKTGSH